MKLKAVLFLSIFLISHTPDTHAFTFYDISSWLSNVWNSARSRLTQQGSPQFIARLRSLFSTQQPIVMNVESERLPGPTPEEISSVTILSEISSPPTAQASRDQAQDLYSKDLFKSNSLDFALEIGSTSGFNNPGAQRENNPRDFMAMLIYDINSYLVGQRDTKQTDIFKLAAEVENLRSASFKERQQMYQDIVKLIGRLYAKRAVYNLEYKVKSLFSIPSNFPIKAYLDFTNNVQEALITMLKSPALYHEQDVHVLEAIYDWFTKLKPLPQEALDAMNKSTQNTNDKYPKEKESIPACAKQISPNEFFTSDVLYILDERRKENAFLVLRNQQTYYALNYLHDFLNKKMSQPDEYYGLTNYIKQWSHPEYIKKQNPDFYTDVVKEIGRAYINAQTDQELQRLNDKLLYIFGGSTDYEKNLSTNLQKALGELLALSNNNPDLERHHKILQYIRHIAQASFGKHLSPEWKKHLTDRKQYASSGQALTFDRELMSGQKGDKVEGYWASSKNPSEDVYQGKYPFPQAHDEPWPTQEEFLQKLAVIERTLEASNQVKSYLSAALSRFEPIHVGNREFKYYDQRKTESIRWPESFGVYYVRKFNVKPSKEFYNWVMNYNSSGPTSAQL